MLTLSLLTTLFVLFAHLIVVLSKETFIAVSFSYKNAYVVVDIMSLILTSRGQPLKMHKISYFNRATETSLIKIFSLFYLR